MRLCTRYQSDQFIELDSAKRFGFTRFRFIAKHAEALVFFMFCLCFPNVVRAS